MSLLAATFNVNGISARLPRVLDWLKDKKPDIACLQEIKCPDERFPTAEISDLGYTIAVQGQKSFNGVAILSRIPFSVTFEGLPGDKSDSQARFLEVRFDLEAYVFKLASLYLPNGNPCPGEKFDYKLDWMRRLIKHTRQLLVDEIPFALLGDFNVCPSDLDCFDPRLFADDALLHPKSRALWHELKWLGLTDAIRHVDPTGSAYSYWDYQAGAWARDRGLRIDHILLSPELADRLTDAGIDRAVRGLERPSDHVPVWCRIEAAA